MVENLGFYKSEELGKKLEPKSRSNPFLKVLGNSFILQLRFPFAFPPSISYTTFLLNPKRAKSPLMKIKAEGREGRAS